MPLKLPSWLTRRVESAAPGPRPISNAENARMIRARFENSLTSADNRQLWALADATSVDAAANFMVRRQLRMRCRHVYHNNPYAMGCANRLAKFVVGTGPKLHLGTGSKEINAQVERQFHRWCNAVKLSRKLRVSRAARFYNGEGFCLMRTNPKLKHPVKLDVFEIEADQVASPLFGIFPSQYPDQWFDGVVLDPWGNPETYHVLRQHPGAFGAFLVMGTEFDPWPANYVIHDYDRLRPAQQRGIPEMTPAADLFEEARRYRRAVLGAAETAAEYAGVVKTQGPASDDDTPGTRATPDSGFGTSADYMEIRRRQLAVLPAGWEIQQMKAEQPTTNYDPYVLSLMTEASQVLDMPLFIVTGDARLANMSSAYVATQSFIHSVVTTRDDYNGHMDSLFLEWLNEARRINGMIPREVPDEPDHSWRWPRITSHADPQKMANAQTMRLKSGTRSPSLECADEGLNYEEICERAASDYGVDVPTYKKALFQSTFSQSGNPVPAVMSSGQIDPDADVDDTDLDESGGQGFS